MLSKSEKHVPINLVQWRRLAKKYNATGGIEELGSPKKVVSASRFAFNNFIGLQVIYEFPKASSELPAKITGQFPPSSNARLESLNGYNVYLNEIEKFGEGGGTRDAVSPTCVSKSLGAFVNVWQFQQHVMLGDDNAADVSKISKVSPAVDRAKAKATASALPQTPTPAPRSKNLSLRNQLTGLSLDDDEEFIDREKEIQDDGTAEHFKDSSDDDDDDDKIESGK